MFISRDKYLLFYEIPQSIRQDIWMFCGIS